jgi:hypothetical protein
MPHPNANRKDVDTLPEAFQYLRDRRENRRLWTILKFDTGEKYHIFRSTSTFTQQMFNISKTIFEHSGHYGRGQPHGRQLAADMTDTLVLGQVGQEHAWGGHAEEHMLQYFDICRGLCASAPTTAILWNSDNPCTPQDRQPSANMTNWPLSCTAKVDRLATLNPGLTVMVYIRQVYGVLQGRTMAAAIGVLKGLTAAPNLRFVDFSAELRHQSGGL